VSDAETPAPHERGAGTFIMGGRIVKKIAITPETTVEDLVEEHPAAIRFLMERGIICMR